MSAFAPAHLNSLQMLGTVHTLAMVVPVHGSIFEHYSPQLDACCIPAASQYFSIAEEAFSCVLTIGIQSCSNSAFTADPVLHDSCLLHPTSIKVKTFSCLLTVHGHMRDFQCMLQHYCKSVACLSGSMLASSICTCLSPEGLQCWPLTR